MVAKLSQQPHLNRSQKSAFDQLIALGRLKFSAVPHPNLRIRPRILPLLYGPTGAGKSFLAEHLAVDLAAHFLRVEIANWIPVGARDAEYTTATVRNALAKFDRLILFIDELDKLSLDSSSWNRSVQAEVWATLDLSIRTDHFLILGAGTWQHEHDRRSVGFGNQKQRIEFGRVPKELLLRFSHFFALAYPCPVETAEIFRACGIQQLADEMGYPLESTKHDWTGGMRSIERLCTTLLLAQAERNAGQVQRTMELLRNAIRPFSGRIPDGRPDLS